MPDETVTATVEPVSGHPPRFRIALRSLAATTALVGLAVACTGTDAGPSDGASSPATPAATGALESPSPSLGGEVPTDAGRLVVIDDVGNLSTLAPDGSDPVVVAEAIQGRTVVRQPAWSPDGRRLAWVQLVTGDAGLDASVVTVSRDGTARTEAPTGVAPFYLSWDPTSSRVAYLGSTSTGIELGIVDIDHGGTAAEPLDEGSPLYLSWNPSGQQMLVHVGENRLDTLKLDGTLTSVHARPGTFNAPVWTADGRSLVYASRDANRQHLVLHDVDTSRGRDLVPFDGIVRFVASSDGSKVAFQVADAGRIEPLRVVDTTTGTIEQLSEAPAPAFFWSPDGDRLLYLVPESDGGRAWLRWHIWDGERTVATPRFLPSPVFAREYLQFFDQYAQSMSLWAPDGSAFTYAGISESGEQGIWIQPARDGEEPILVARGVFASWSPA